MAQLKNITINDVGYLELPTGSTRPSSPSVGMIRYNSSSGNVEGYAASGWHILSPINLAITAVTPVSGFVDSLSSTKQINPNSAAVFTISGFNFTNTTTVKFDSFTLPSGMVTFVNPETLSVNTGTSGLTASSYSTVVVVDSNGKSSSLSYPITVNGGPVFSTSTNLGTITEGNNISITILASSPGQASVSYSANTISGNGGSGYGLPNGLSINASTGAITGTLIDYTGGIVQYNITIKATDTIARTASKDFTFVLTNSVSPTITAPSAGSIGTLYYQPGSAGAGVSAAPSTPGITSITSTNPSGTTLEYILSSGSLPPGVSLNSTAGSLYGNIIIGNRNPTGQVYNFGITVKDSNNNSSAEVQYSLTTNIPYYYRQILSTGYSIAGYKNSTPWKNVNRFPMSTEISISLGDQLTYAVNYHGGACGPDKSYIAGCNSSGGMQASGTLTQAYNMRTEVGTIAYTSSYSRGSSAVWSGNDGFQQYLYVSGGFQGTGANAVEKMPYSTETPSIISTTLASTTNYWDCVTAATETFAGIVGSADGYSGGTSVTTAFWTFATDTVAAAGVNISAGTQEKVLSSKLNRVYGGTNGTTAGSTNFTKTIWSDLTQFTVACGYGNKAEENYIMGQDKGYCVGLYNGASQLNDAFIMIYATDTSLAANYGLQRKATTGSSSGNYGYRD